MTGTRDQSLSLSLVFFTKEIFRALLDASNAIFVEDDGVTLSVERPIYGATLSRRIIFVQIVDQFVPRDLLEILLQLLFKPHQAVVLAGPNVKAESDVS